MEYIHVAFWFNNISSCSDQKKKKKKNHEIIICRENNMSAENITTLILVYDVHGRE